MPENGLLTDEELAHIGEGLGRHWYGDNSGGCPYDVQRLLGHIEALQANAIAVGKERDTAIGALCHHCKMHRPVDRHGYHCENPPSGGVSYTKCTAPMVRLNIAESDLTSLKQDLDRLSKERDAFESDKYNNAAQHINEQKALRQRIIMAEAERNEARAEVDRLASTNSGLVGEVEELRAKITGQALWADGPNGVLVLTPAGVRALEYCQEQTDRIERLIADNDSLRAQLDTRK